LQYLVLNDVYASKEDLLPTDAHVDVLYWPRKCFERLPGHFEQEAIVSNILRAGTTLMFARSAASCVKAFKRLLAFPRPVPEYTVDQVRIPDLNEEQLAVAGIILETSTSPDERRPFVILGKAGTGKSVVFLHLARRFYQDHQQPVLYTCPTGKLVADVKNRVRIWGLEDVVVVDTCHRAFGLEISDGSYSVRSHNLHEYSLILIDEMSMLSASNAMRIVSKTANIAPRTSVVFGGDFRQLPPPCVPHTERLVTSKAFWSSVHPRLVLHNVVRSDDRELLLFLEIIRVRSPTFEELRSFVSSRSYCRFWYVKGESSDDDIRDAVRESPNSTWLCATNKNVSRVNRVSTECYAERLVEAGQLVKTTEITDAYSEQVLLIPGAPLMLTTNVDIDEDLVNGEVFTFIEAGDVTLTLRNCLGEIRIIEQLQIPDGPIERAIFPVRLAYAATIHKLQGSTLDNITLWLESGSVEQMEGIAYVGCSRVRKAGDIRFFGYFRTHSFIPTRV
jgi:hypothetical protein